MTRSAVVLALFAILAVASPASAEMRSLVSASDFETTLANLRGAIEASPASIIHEVDHAAGAEGAGLELAPTTLVVFGNPAAGTKLMQADPTAGLSLPMKMLVAETEEGVKVVYDDPASLAEMHDLGEAAAVTEKMSGLVAKLAEAATK